MRQLGRVSIALLMIGLFVGISAAKSFFKPGDPAPNFTLETLDGQTISLSQYKGKVVVLGLFHICEPCMEQGTELQKVHDAFQGKNVQVLGVNSAGNAKDKVKGFLNEFPVKVTYPYMVDPKKETDKLFGGGRFIPNVYVIRGHQSRGRKAPCSRWEGGRLLVSEEFDEGKKKFLEVVKSIDPDVEIVVPVTPSRGNFLIALSKGKARKFISVNEDDLIELPENDDVVTKMTGDLKVAIAGLAVS